MNSELYQQLFNKLDSLGAIRKDLTLGCEITTCECGDGCCGIEEGVIGEKYGKCEKGITSYIGTRFSVNIMEVKGHPPVLTDCIKAIKAINKGKLGIPLATTVLMEWDYNLPLLSEQSDELGEYLITLLK